MKQKTLQFSALVLLLSACTTITAIPKHDAIGTPVVFNHPIVSYKAFYKTYSGIDRELGNLENCVGEYADNCPDRKYIPSDTEFIITNVIYVESGVSTFFLFVVEDLNGTSFVAKNIYQFNKYEPMDIIKPEKDVCQAPVALMDELHRRNGSMMMLDLVPSHGYHKHLKSRLLNACHLEFSRNIYSGVYRIQTDVDGMICLYDQLWGRHCDPNNVITCRP